MLRTLDIILIVVMTVAATITYSIKHIAELKLGEVRRLEAEIKLERNTIDLLKADWALLTQPNRLEHLVKVYDSELHLQQTESTQLVQPVELPKLRSELTEEEIAKGEKARLAAIAANNLPNEEEIPDVAKVAESQKKEKNAKKTLKSNSGTDNFATGSVKR